MEWIDGYEVLEVLGEGSFGLVLRARAPDGREVALKLLKGAGPLALARFERERQLQQRLEGAGFVPVLAWGMSSVTGRMVFMLDPIETKIGSLALVPRLSKGSADLAVTHAPPPPWAAEAWKGMLGGKTRGRRRVNQRRRGGLGSAPGSG